MASFLLFVTWLSWVVRSRIGDRSVRDVKYDHVKVPLISQLEDSLSKENFFDKHL